MRIFLLFILFSSIVPVAENGRYVPLEVTQQEDWMALPSRTEPGQWLPLSYLKQTHSNFTAYSEEDFNHIRQAYLNSDEEALKTALLNAYRSIENQPIQDGLHYPSIGQLRAEQFYHTYPLYFICLLLYIASCFTSRWRLPLILLAFTLHTIDLGLRIYILERPPVSNMAETILYVPWVAVALALLFYKERTLLFASAVSAAVLISLGMGSTLENVQPVLNSQLWLTVHVLMVVGSYGAFILAGVLGHLYLITKNQKLTPYTLATLYIGTFLLIIGTILGGVWAAQSWGRFWDWDPKESWAFISSCTYLVIVHLYRFKLIGPQGLHNGAIIGMLSITFTWYGVNYILGTGFHSYGFGSGGSNYYFFYLLAEIIFLAWYNQLPRKWEKLKHPFSVKRKCDKYPKITREGCKQ